MKLKDYKVGTVLKSRTGQFTKIVSIKNGVYGISGWTNLVNAKKATIARQFMNGYGLKYAGVTVEKAGTGKVKAPTKPANSKSTATAPKPKTPAQKAAATRKANAAKKAAEAKKTAK